MAIMCPYCQQPAQLATGAEIYRHRPDLAKLCFWACFPCGAYVGCHKLGAWIWKAGKKVVSDGTIPLGRLANAELRQAKQAAHAAFDPTWKDRGQPRRTAYAWLAHKLGIPVDDCHIGEFDVERCRRVVAIVKEEDERQRQQHPHHRPTAHP